MDSDSLLKLFDTCWFELEILRKQASNPTTRETLEFPSADVPAISARSMDELVSSSSSGSSISSFSPNSVLPTKRLRPIFSGKQMSDFLSEHEEEEEVLEASRTAETAKSCSGEERRKSRSRGMKSSRRTKRGLSKSLSDLEFEEIKGFMELGFVFSAEDKSSEFLATILPGLHRLGVEEEAEMQGSRKNASRPYLSEAWQISDRNRVSRPLTMSWEELPPVNSKTHMKDYLKSWAQTVVYSVK